MNKTRYIILSIVLCFSLAFVVYPTRAYAAGFWQSIFNAIAAIVTAVVNVVVAVVTAVVNAIVHVVQSIFTPAQPAQPAQPAPAQPQYRCSQCT